MITKPKTYTEEYVKKEVQDLYEDTLSRQDVLYLGELLDAKPYTLQRISEWKELGGEISETIEKIKDILGQRVIAGSLKNKYNVQMAKFHLINNYGWRDKTETDITSGGKPLPILNNAVLSDICNKENSEAK